MAKGSAGVIGGITAFGMDSESSLVEGLFEVKDLKRMKQLTEVTPDLIYPIAMLGLVQRVTKSSILKMGLEELFLILKSKDRQGIDEWLEVATAIKRGHAGEED